MQLKISGSNSKIGKIPNISLPPGKTCISGAPCFNEGCYAVGPYKRYSATKKAWDNNLKLWNKNPGRFESELREFLWDQEPDRFRWHVGGDVPDQKYMDMVCELADCFEDTQFLMFTKRYSWIEQWDLSENLTVVLSMWPGIPVPENKANLPMAWLAEDPRAPADQFHIRCPGGCEACGYKCWDSLSHGMRVIFDKH